MNNVRILVDGKYLQAVLKECYGEAKIDICKLIRKLSGGKLASATYYYPLANALQLSTELERERAVSADRFLYALSTHGVGVKRTTEVTLYTQMTLDIFRLVSGGRIDEIVIFSESLALGPAIDVAREEGLTVTLWHGPKRTKELDQLTGRVDDHHSIEFEDIGQMRLSA
jgi:uncharacterized LabA/DUF88 family protein